MWGRTSLGGLNNERLLARRRRNRRPTLFGVLLLLVIISSAFLWGVRQSAVRVSKVQVYGTEEPLSEIAAGEMRGSYGGIIPRNSTFFLPIESIRHDILTRYTDIAAVSIFRVGMTGLSIKVDYRVPIARWCGSTSSPQVASSTENCYVFDASGVIFATVATSTQTINSFKLYAPLEGETLEPLRATLSLAALLPGAFDFARELSTFGSPVSSIVVRDGEVSNFLASGTRVTYLLGDEQNAFTALVSARGNLNFADGSLEYVDLRFGGKIYLKRK